MGYAQSYASFDPYGGLTEEEERTVSGPYWLRHWRGQLPLARSYWVNGFIVNLLLLGGQTGLLALTNSRQLVLIAWAFLIFVAASLALRVWSFVGIWRSANRHVERGGSAFWAFVARAIIVLVVLSVVVSAPRAWLQIREMALIATGHDRLGAPATIKLSADGSEITLDGNIATGTSSQFSKTLAAAPHAQRLTLNSHGGRILEALAMVDQIKARRLDTRVVENCESACTLLFLAGAQRSASSLAQIGFHQPDSPGLTPQERQQIIESNSQDYRAAGIGEDFIQHIMATPPKQMWYPSYAEMTSAGVVNALVVSNRPDRRETSRLNQALAMATRNINSRRGNMLDKITELEGAAVKDDWIIVDLLLTRQVPLSSSRIAAALTPVLQKKICGGPDSALINAGGKYRFDYRYSNGLKAATVKVQHCY